MSSDPVDIDVPSTPTTSLSSGTRSSALGASGLATAAIEPQPQRAEILVGVEVGRMPPVFGTGQPPRGLSGVIRRRAYAIPEHHAGHWLLLLLGDRVDVWESRIRRHPGIALGMATFAMAALVAGIGGRAVARSRRAHRPQALGARLASLFT